MKPKIEARTTTPIAAIASRTVVDSVGKRGPGAAGAGVGSMDSALDRLPALRAELHVAGDLVTVGASQGLGSAAFPAELEPRRNRLATFDARLAPRRDRRVGTAVPAELRRCRVHRAALRARPLLLLLLLRRLGDHPAHLGAHRVSHADPRAEPDARARAAERADELVDERLRVLQAVPEISERSELDHVEVRVLEQERILGPELAVEDPLLEVVDLRLLDDAGQGLDQSAQDRRILGRECVPVRSVEVGEDLAVAVEHRDLVLPDDDVVVHPDVPRDLPHDVLSLELVIPGDRHGAAQAFLVARRLVRSLSAAEKESDWDHGLTSPGCR